MVQMPYICSIIIKKERNTNLSDMSENKLKTKWILKKKKKKYKNVLTQ